MKSRIGYQFMYIVLSKIFQDLCLFFWTIGWYLKKNTDAFVGSKIRESWQAHGIMTCPEAQEWNLTPCDPINQVSNESSHVLPQCHPLECTF